MARTAVRHCVGHMSRVTQPGSHAAGKVPLLLTFTRHCPTNTHLAIPQTSIAAPSPHRLPHQYTPGHPPNLDCRTITTSIAPPIHTWPPSKPRLPHHHHHHIDCRTERTSFLTSTSTRGWLHPEMVAQGFAFPGMPELLTSCRSALKNSSSWRTWGTSSLLLAPSPAVERGNRCDNPSCSRRPACSARRRGARIRHT
jgi:hypothetical protein